MRSKKMISALDDLFAADRDGFVRSVQALDGAAIDEDLVRHMDGYRDFFQRGKRMIATTDPARMPAPDEFVVCFGNYPPGYHALPINNPVRRNLLDFFSWDQPFDAVEGHPCWRKVEKCFVINLDERPDRFYTTLRELARVGFPLDRIVRFSGHVAADTGDRRLDGQIGCLRSHLEVVTLVQEEGYPHALVLEDDFGFLDDQDRVRNETAQFFARGYDYDVCLLATSNFGPIEPLDDLVSVTRQRCTNTSGHFISSAGAGKLRACFGEALERLQETGDQMRFAVDRCWTALQGERFLVFKRRMGFQLPSFSDIEGRITLYFD